MSEPEHIGFDSTANVTYIYQDKGGRQPPGGDDMEARVEKLERIAEDTRGTLESIQRQLARIDTKLDSKPDFGKLYTAIFTVYGLSFTIIAAGAAIAALLLK